MAPQGAVADPYPVTRLGYMEVARVAESRNPGFDVGDVVAFYGYAFFLVVPIRTAVEAADKVTRSLVGARRIVTVLSTRPALDDPATRSPG